jgi:hypothetical protein
MSDDHNESWAELGSQAKDTIVAALSGIVRLAQDNFLLLIIVGLTGAISYQSLYEMALSLNPDPQAKWVAQLFPLQLDAAAVPAYQVAADELRAWYHRWLGAFVCLIALGGSVYGNLVAHLRWGGDAPKVFVSVVPPVMCAAALLLFHLPRITEVVVGVVEARSPHRSDSPHKPPESSVDETEVTPEAPSKVGAEGPRAKETPASLAPPVLHSVGAIIPEGPWDDVSAPSQRRYIAAFWDLNGREPTPAEVCDNMPPEVRAQRGVSAQIRAVREKRTASA